MSEIDLPGDLNRWPSDPFILLGVNHATERRDVRKAYASLIRIFKPEHFPEHFRRLRDAYETLDQRLSWMESRGEPEEPIETAPYAEAAVSSTAEAHAEVLDDDVGRPPRDTQFIAMDTDSLWDDARSGSFDLVYGIFSQMAEQGHSSEELYARLFWLLRVDRQLDPDRDPRDWLVAGLKRCGLRGRLPELYVRELAEDPYEALHRRCEDVLRCSGHQGLLAELVIARWDAAAKLEKWDVFHSDLAALRGRLRDEPAVWGRLLLAAIDNLAWSEADSAADTLHACRTEIEQLAEHYLPITSELDQRDILLDLVKSCEQLPYVSNLPPNWRRSLRELLVNSWNQPLENFRHQLLGVLATLVQNPVAGLECLDRLDLRCRPALHRLGALIRMLATSCGIGQESPFGNDPDDAESKSPKQVLDRLVDFMVAASRKRYPIRWKKWMHAAENTGAFGRKELLLFCIQESISVQQLMDYVASSLRQDLLQFLAPADNAALHYICLAYLAFWK